MYSEARKNHEFMMNLFNDRKLSATDDNLNEKISKLSNYVLKHKLDMNKPIPLANRLMRNISQPSSPITLSLNNVIDGRLLHNNTKTTTTTTIINIPNINNNINNYIPISSQQVSPSLIDIQIRPPLNAILPQNSKSNLLTTINETLKSVSTPVINLTKEKTDNKYGNK
ncbi:hypothetical protein BCR32DRAFT_287538 [Anaeromyces robustus]|uniref:Uncharacterized protein n=1 Tax=Anaeromyces robustus TaxID=1754192 RepID=A0A1Y1VRX7_9FUNG|nr:hypothetical protein BCR32DRAFT_287538 [Anaeromyces robustus]|eukprot:ORX63776.1 hypothetical protein BCR32DRAFT_287538 [Anaeromyces robustus]